ncbi:MAG: hypothetical protein H0U73_06665, partial [Tatlockia sp.]|nr:hypothetical protein [Tatlockia sp.]
KIWFRESAGLGLFTKTLYFTAGLGVTALGAAGIYGVVVGSISLAMGPWAVVGIAVGIALLGLVLAAIAAYGMYKNVRALRDSQINDIRDFVYLLDPEPFKKIEVKPVDMPVSLNGFTQEMYDARRSVEERSYSSSSTSSQTF